MHDEGSYTCGECGEEVVVPIDVSAGGDQDYVEDCPVCCRPHRIRVRIERDGSFSLQVELE